MTIFNKTRIEEATDRILDVIENNKENPTVIKPIVGFIVANEMNKVAEKHLNIIDSQQHLIDYLCQDEFREFIKYLLKHEKHHDLIVEFGENDGWKGKRI